LEESLLSNDFENGPGKIKKNRSSKLDMSSSILETPIDRPK